MPKFIYTARSFSGETKGGEAIANDEKSLAHQLRSEGYLVTSVKQLDEQKTKSGAKFLDRFMSVPLKEKMMFARNLSVMISSGVNISRALGNLTLQTDNKTFKKVLTDISADLQAGKAFSEGLAKYPSVFGDLFTNMVRVGEVGGNLDEVLLIVAIQLEKEHDLRSKVQGALIYPSVIVIAMIGIGFFMLTYILPKIIGVFGDMNVQLPKPTLFLIWLSDTLRNHMILAVGGMFSAGLFTKIFLSTDSGKRTLSYFLIKMPPFNKIVIKINCARFSRILSSLLKSGVSVIDAMKIISDTLTNYYYKRELVAGIEQVKTGVALSKVISLSPKIFPIIIPQMLEVGEETGKTEDVMLKLAEFYEEEVNQITKNLSSIIEPILMLLIGGAVGFFAVAMMQPMYSVLENIQ